MFIYRHMLDEFYTIDEVAKAMKVEPRTIKRMIKAKKINAFNVSAGERIRPTWRFVKGDIDRFLANEFLANEDNFIP